MRTAHKRKLTADAVALRFECALYGTRFLLYLTFVLILYILSINSKRGKHMDIIIRNSSNQPIYEQIYIQIKELIINGALAEGEMLPSIRGLAKDLRISVITTKRAYDELEREGYVNTVTGKGCFVAGTNRELIQEEYLKKIEGHMQEIQKLAKSCGITKEELLKMFSILEVEE